MTLLNRDQLSSLTEVLRKEPVLSVYIDGTAPDPSSTQWRTALGHAIDAARAEARLDHAGRADFDRAVELLHERLAGQTAGLGAPGWVGFIGPRAVHYANRCPVRMPTLVAWDVGARIAPYTRALASGYVAIIALVDARKIEVFEYRGGALHRAAEFRAHHVDGQATHLGRGARKGFHIGTRGGTGRDRLQRALQEGTARMEREAVQYIMHRAGAGEAILVAGTPQHRHDLLKRLAAEAPGRVDELPTVDIHATPAQIVEAVGVACDVRRRDRIEREVKAVIETAGARGSAALGPEATRWALDRGRVQSLYVTPRFVDAEPDRAESAVRLALAQSADIEVAINGGAVLDAHGGVGARLRFRLLD